MPMKLHIMHRLRKAAWLAILPMAPVMLAPRHAHGAERPPQRAELLAAGCKTLTERVAAVPGSGPVFLGSYEPAPGGAALAPALTQAAFVYDNALASVALVACRRPDEARRIADAILQASRQDRHYHDARVRNAYRAGALPPGAAPLPGWWDAPSKRWFEDAYQAGTATGNVAWAALSLLAVHEATHDERYLDGAAALMRWVDPGRLDAAAPAGYVGGEFGHEPRPIRQGWKSTEHNVDAYAVFHWLAERTGEARWRAAAERARGFVAAMWDAREGRFLIGTRDDGHSPNIGPSALDASLWPLLAIPDAPADWHRSLAWVERAHRIDGGYGFNAHPDGIWTEGTGQAALTLQAVGDDDKARPLWALLLAQRAPSGLLYATPEPRIRTGLSIGPTSTTEDFYYFHLPHLGATAWAVLAAAGWNPFRPGGCLPAGCPGPRTAAPNSRNAQE
ncbi:hypothetical protein WS71_05595 [Burkholderia mayonis]|uniref:Methylaspartate ammonia-lyase n=2 Tax=Burkholderia mayonis TaxID=1385591 RepID=A0A1B4FT47_9BURK|nr:hypothetical protein [Burkholderia mayonis]AOJ06848.1 hypothetical protein WS71_05595 [Burkholderia mayonis]KVE57632.1 hypothetical protein WS71_26225 [Burkholderia mayonis]